MIETLMFVLRGVEAYNYCLHGCKENEIKDGVTNFTKE